MDIETLRNAHVDSAENVVMLAEMGRLLATQPAVFLSTLDDTGWPDTRAMLNLRNPKHYPGLVSLFASHDKDFMLLFTTNASSAKYRQLQRDPRASVYICQADQFHGLRFQGEMEIVEGALRRQVWQPDWAMYYPDGPDSDDYVVLRMFPRVAKYYHAFQLREIRFPQTERPG